VEEAEEDDEQAPRIQRPNGTASGASAVRSRRLSRQTQTTTSAEPPSRRKSQVCPTRGSA
jgi:hypothetical protein